MEPSSHGEHRRTPGQIGEAIAPVLARHRVKRAWLFGPCARGEPTRHSDIDLIVVQETTQRFLDRYEGLYLDLCRALPGAEIEQIAHRPFIRSALSQGVPSRPLARPRPS